MATGIDKLSKVFTKINKAVEQYSSKKTVQKVGDDLVDLIVKRTKQGRGADNKPWPGKANKYTTKYGTYKKSIVGKAKPVDLTFTEQLLNALRAIVRGNNKSRSVETKFYPDSRSDSKSKNSEIAKGHAAYGRDFLALGKADEAKIKATIFKTLKKAIRKEFRG